MLPTKPRLSAPSLVCLFICLGGSLLLASGCGPPAGNDPNLPTVLPARPARPPVLSPVQFTDVTHAAGIKFRHHNGAFGLHLYPETMGSGAAFIDYDGDGYQDIFFVNGRDWTAAEINTYLNGNGRRHHQLYGYVAPRPGASQRTTGALYHNNGNGTFSDVTRGSGLDVEMLGMGVAVGDYDNDGRPDLYVTGYGRNYLFHNGSTPGHVHFQEVAASAGVQDSGYSASAAWVDYDRDGLLDLFVCRYIAWNPAIDEWDFAAPTKDKRHGYAKAYSGPVPFKGVASHLYHNLGGGRFVDVSERAGISFKAIQQQSAPVAPHATPVATTDVAQSPKHLTPAQQRGKSLGVAVCDLNGDGWPDLVVANDEVRNYVFLNQRNGTFAERGMPLGLAYSASGKQRAGMGVDTGDLDHSGHDSIVVGNFHDENIGLYHDAGTGTFSDIAALSEVAVASHKDVTFGCLCFDADNDGWLDMLAANGHVQDTIHTMRPDLSYAERPLFYLNRGQRQPIKFDEVGLQSGPALSRPIVGRGLAYADFDLDGDLDVLITTNGGAPMLLRNDLGQKARLNHVLRLTLEGTRSNRSAIGAQVQATMHMPGPTGDVIRDVVLQRMVKSGSSYLSQSELPLTLGLGRAAQVKSLSILWPSGQRTQLHNLAADQMLTVREDSGIVAQRPLHR